MHADFDQVTGLLGYPVTVQTVATEAHGRGSAAEVALQYPAAVARCTSSSLMPQPHAMRGGWRAKRQPGDDAAARDGLDRRADRHQARRRAASDTIHFARRSRRIAGGPERAGCGGRRRCVLNTLPMATSLSMALSMKRSRNMRR
jgi:hypothetical protein